MKLPLKLAALKADYLAACAPFRALYAELPPEPARSARLDRLAGTPEAAAVREAGATYADALESWLATPAGQRLPRNAVKALRFDAAMARRLS